MPTLVIFGASGDLTSRKLIPSLYQLNRKGRLPADTRVVGVARSEFTDESWRENLAKTTEQFSEEEFDAQTWTAFARQIYYQPGDIGKLEDFNVLARRLKSIEPPSGGDRVYYLATAPQFYGPAIEHLGASGLADDALGARRVVIEKPFGMDRASARDLNRDVHKVFREDQVYRIDHYLGKETVQNILVLRFANTIFEPIWNRNYIDHVQITVAEEVPVGRRGGYYDRSGVLRDMFQNHLLQLLMVVAMEAPVRYKANPVRDEKVKVLEAIRPLDPQAVARDTLRAQYRGYRQEPGVAADSQTATFAALKLAVDNWRWQGVPFYLRSGKNMACRTTQIVIQFRDPPHMMFRSSKGISEANRLVIQVQPGEGIRIEFLTKTPDAGMQLQMTGLDFQFAQRFSQKMPEAYQRLLLDVFNGDASLFARADEVELAWGVIDPILAAWESSGRPDLHEYEPNDWGPTAASVWMALDGRDWYDVCPVLAHH